MKYGFTTPCWGCPAWFIDNDNHYVYMFSAKYRTTQEFVQFKEDNKYIITKFPLPDINAGKFIILTPKDILDQFFAPFDILFTQGGMIKRNKLFYTFGLGDDRYPLGMRIYDLNKKSLWRSFDLSTSIFGEEEIESCSFYKDELICNTNADVGGLFSLGCEISNDMIEDM